MLRGHTSQDRHLRVSSQHLLVSATTYDPLMWSCTGLAEVQPWGWILSLDSRLYCNLLAVWLWHVT